ncbi:uncharacterized protein DEA37_0010064 [Paragonimus westermani]|uniref:Uncharacterized protein n=1 Tax=Paragonimus westermani TaxID=34504 RepID=A0A5J4NAY6_9TREM|nr:uncharacterized protein DEA37_0010064 [Paragonimus westermani]
MTDLPQSADIEGTDVYQLSWPRKTITVRRHMVSSVSLLDVVPLLTGQLLLGDQSMTELSTVIVHFYLLDNFFQLVEFRGMIKEESLPYVVDTAPPPCPSNASAETSTIEESLQALLNTGTSESCLLGSIDRRYRWTFEKLCNAVNMASVRLTSRTQGHCCVSIRYTNCYCDKIKPSVLPNLRADVLLGCDSLKLYEKVEISFNSRKSPHTP